MALETRKIYGKKISGFTHTPEAWVSGKFEWSQEVSVFEIRAVVLLLR